MNIFWQFLIILIISVIIIVVLYISDVMKDKNENKQDNQNDDINYYDTYIPFENNLINSSKINYNTINENMFNQHDKTVNIKQNKGDFDVPKFDTINMFSESHNQAGIDTSNNPRYESFIGFDRTKLSGINNTDEIQNEKDVSDESAGILQRGQINRFNPIEPRISTFDRLHGNYGTVKRE